MSMLLAAQLQDEGAKSFVKSWNELMAVINSKSSALKERPKPEPGLRKEHMHGNAKEDLE